VAQLEYASPMPVYLRLERMLQERIQAGILRPGSKLPSELELALRFRVSRSTIRKVLNRLVVDGLITKWPGKGSYVSEHRLTLSPNSLSFSAQMTSAGHAVTTQVLLRCVITAPEHVAHALRLSAEGKVIHFRRLRLLDGEPAAIHGTLLPYPEYEKITEDELGTQSLSHAMEWATGERVVSSRDLLSVVQANAEDAALLHIPPKSPVVQITGVGLTEASKPVRYTEALYRSDRFDFAVNNSVPAPGALSRNSLRRVAAPV
jgi:GntR family transcriptional regulator